MNKKIILTIIILAIAILVATYVYKKPIATMTTEHMDTKTDTMMEATSTMQAVKDIDADRKAMQGDLVVVNYTGTLENGTKFDSSYDRGEPIAFLLGKGMVIKGWDEQILGMKAGEKKHLVITGDKAYGAREIKGPDGKVLIPKNATLVFDIEIMQVMSAERVAEMMKKQQAMKDTTASTSMKK